MGFSCRYVCFGWDVGEEAWQWRCHLLVWEEELVREYCIFLTNVQVQDDIADSWYWQLDKGIQYSIGDVYLFLTSS